MRGVCERQVRRTIHDKRSVKFWHERSRRKWQIHSPRCAISPFSSTLISPSLTCDGSHFVSLFFLLNHVAAAIRVNLAWRCWNTLLRYRYSNCISAGYRYAECGMGIISSEHFASKARKQKQYRTAITEKLAYTDRYLTVPPRSTISCTICCNHTKWYYDIHLSQLPRDKITAANDILSENQPVVREY